MSDEKTIVNLVLLGQTVSEFLSESRTLGYMLWGGLAILTITLLILMRTRWGQVKPISKCIMLSVFAHILLGGYAYGTRLIFMLPEEQGVNSGTVVELSFVDGEETGDRDQASEKPWDAFMGEPVAAPQIVSAKKPDPQFETARVERETLAVEQPVPIEQSELAAEISQEIVEEPLEEVVAQQEVPSAISAATVIPPPALPAQLNETSTAQTDAVKPEATPDISAAETKLQPLDASPQITDIERQAIEAKQAHQQLANLQWQHQTIGQQVVRETDSFEELNRLTQQHSHRFNNTQLVGHPSRQKINEAAVAGLSVRRLSDGQLIPKIYALRVNENRRAIAVENGGTAESEAVVESALQWLANNQSTDGRWDAQDLGGGRENFVLGHNRGNAGANADTGITGLTLLAFLGAGHSHMEGDYQETVQRGLEFLMRCQRNDGNLAGNAKLFASMYCHGIATLAVSEAYALTGDQRFRPFVQKALGYSVNSQHPRTGGWRYRPGDDGDMSQFGWQVMALKSGELARVPVPVATRNGMHRFLNSCVTGRQGGLASYRPMEKASPTMTAEAFCCRLFLDQPIDDAMKDEAANYLLSELPSNGKANYYYWYYGTMASYQMGGEPWEKWNRALQTQLINRQRKDGRFTGSFDPDSVWGGYGGRAFTTAMSALCLEVYYRYLPILESN